MMIMNIDAFISAEPVVQLHIISALGALLVGTVQMVGAKGTLPHRTLGIAFVVLMVSAALSAIFIRYLNNGNFSLIHIFVPLTIIGLYRLVFAVRRGDRAGHRKQVLGLFYGALIIPGVLSFLPGRLMHEIVFGG
jgi:uncharacterized membrane protein